MATSVLETGKDVKLDRVVNYLLSNDKYQVKQGINEANEIVNNYGDKNIEELYGVLEKPLINALTVPLEVCRDKGSSLILHFLENVEPNRDRLTLLIPTIHRRIGDDPILEESEEIHNKLVNLLEFLVTKYEYLIAPYIEEITNILTQGVSCSAPIVKKSCCSCIVTVSYTLRQEFFGNSKKFINPLIGSLTHQHWRVRVSVIDAIGSVVQYGENKLVPEVANSLAKRLFDDSPNVRLEVVKVVGSWLLKLYDRYSFFPLLLPHILTSFLDDSENVQMCAAKLWEAIGRQYLTENEKDYKDRMDLLNESLEHYPRGVNRPSLGCRALVEREAYKFLPAIACELTDWVTTVRVKSAQLLCQVALHAESKITQHINKIFPAMTKAAVDSQPSVVKYVKRAAEYMGYFIPVDVYAKLIVDTVSSRASCGELIIVSCLVTGSQRELLRPHLQVLVPLINSTSSNEAEQIGLNELIKSVITVCQQDSLELGQNIWRTLVANIGLATSETVSDTSLALLQDLFSLEEGLSYREFHNKYCELAFEELKKATLWTLHCHEKSIFIALLNVASDVVEDHTEDIVTILRASTSEENEAEIIVKMLMAVNAVIQNHSKTLPSESIRQTFIESLINEVLLRLAVWRPGRSAEAVRSCAALVLMSCLQAHRPGAQLSSDITSSVLSLAEDSLPSTRLLALSAINSLHVPSFSQDTFSNIIKVVLKRLDDCDGKVRKLAIDTLNNLYSKALEEENRDRLVSSVLVEFVFKTLLIHLDDQQSAVQSKVLECLMVLSKADCALLKSKLEESNLRDKQINDTLMSFLDLQLKSLALTSQPQ